MRKAWKCVNHRKSLIDLVARVVYICMSAAVSPICERRATMAKRTKKNSKRLSRGKSLKSLKTLTLAIKNHNESFLRG